MIMDKALANSTVQWIVGSGDTGKSLVERISYLN
jgi:hypothetical protein